MISKRANNQEHNISIKEIEQMSYTDFIGFVNQWNVLPGAYSTLSKWRIYCDLNKNSRLLEIACTSGFSSRELALSSGCKGIGIDISKPSIEAAKLNKKIYTPTIRINYETADAYTFASKYKFTHIVVGASLKFFPDPKKIFERCVALLDEGGFLLASPFFVKEPIPTQLLLKAEKIFDITPTTENYKEIMKLYRPLEILFEERNNIETETEDELHYYCTSTIDRACKQKNINNQEIYSALYNRLYQIKQMSNELRPYQGYSVLVLRYRKSLYPNRYVELF